MTTGTENSPNSNTDINNKNNNKNKIDNINNKIKDNINIWLLLLLRFIIHSSSSLLKLEKYHPNNFKIVFGVKN